MNLEVELDDLIDADPAFLCLAPADRCHDNSKGEFGFGPSVTTCDGRLEASAFAQGGLM
jgi:hypothetical protein